MNARSLKLLLFLTLTLTLTLCPDDFFAVKDRVIEESRFELAFLYFTPLLVLENVGYTSNIFTYTDETNPDWTADVGVGLRASAIVANRLILQAEDLPSYSYYLENENLRSWSNRFSSAAYSYIGPLNFKVRYSQNELAQRPQLEFSRPFRLNQREWSGEVDLGRHANFYFTAYGRFSELEYDQDPEYWATNLGERLDHRQHAYGLRLSKVVFTRTVIFADFEMIDYLFTASVRDARAHTFSLGVRFPEIGILQGAMSIGLKQFQPGNAVYRTVSRPEGRGDVEIKLFDRLRIGLFYELQTYFSYQASDLFYDNQNFGASAEVYLTRYLKGGASYQDGHLKYFSFLDLQPQRRDRVRQQRYFLAIPLLGSMSLGFAYNVYRLTSDVLGLDHNQNFWGAFISYGF